MWSLTLSNENNFPTSSSGLLLWKIRGAPGAKRSWYRLVTCLLSLSRSPGYQVDLTVNQQFVHFVHLLVCEVEIEHGLLKADNPKRSCLWFHRVVSGLDPDEHSKNPVAANYIDYCADGKDRCGKDHPQSLLHNLKNKKMKETLHLDNIFTYDATWTPRGTSWS